MITDFFKATKKLGIGLAVGSALAMSASTVFAGGKTLFYEKDFTDTSAKVAQYGAGKVSNKLKNGVTFLVYGGNKELIDTARNAAKRFHENTGKHVGFILALDHDNSPKTMRVAYYTLGGTQFADTVLYKDSERLKGAEAVIYDRAKLAYETEFGKLDTIKKSAIDSDIKIASRNPQ